MDYEKKYKDVLEKIRKEYNRIKYLSSTDARDMYIALGEIFPELKESEDERIRKNIISWLKNAEGQTIPINEYNSAIAWLEKQGKPKDYHKLYNEIAKSDWFKKAYVGKSLECNDKQKLAVNEEEPPITFDYIGDFHEGFAIVRVKDKYNFINEEMKVLSRRPFRRWFDHVGSFSEGFAWVYSRGEGWNFINKEGKILSNQWFDAVEYFRGGFARVYSRGKGWNFINKEGKILSNQWFDDVGSFSAMVVKLNGEWNFINKEGKLFDLNKHPLE